MESRQPSWGLVSVAPVATTSPDALRFGAALRARRRARGWSQHYVADAMTALGFSWGQTTVWKSEAGERPVSVAEAAMLAQLFAIDVAVLFGSAPDPGARAELIAEVVCTRARLTRAEAEAAAARGAHGAARAAYAAVYLPPAGGTSRNGTANEGT